MTEQEWEAATDPTLMLEFLQGKVSDRKLRLFCCGCCRTVWDVFDSQVGQYAIDAVERLVDGKATSSELETIHQHSREVLDAAATTEEQSEDDGSPASLEIAFSHRRAALIERTIDPFGWATNGLTGTKRARAASISQWIVDCQYFRSWLTRKKNLTKPARVAIRSQHCNLLRDTFGNPFRPVSVESSWLTSDVCILADSIYQERAFDRMPILADALQDAGCDNNEILNHLRSDRPHVRGCWALDLLLSKS